MLYLLYGSDTYRSRQKLLEIVEGYRKKAGADFVVYRFDAQDDDFAAINSALETGSLFQRKKLVVLQHVFRAGTFEILKFKNLKESQDVIVALREWELDANGAKQLAKFKTLFTKIQEFTVPKKDIHDSTIFQLGDVFFSFRKEAVRKLLDLLSLGHDDLKIFSYLSNYCRTLLMVKTYIERRQPIPTNLGIHPFVIKKASALVRGLNEAQLEKFLQQFFEEDFRIKTGLSTPKDSLLHILFS